MQQQIFLSYRHESPEHARAVRRLGELLRQAGLPVALDQFYFDDHSGGPDQGWPKWCEECASQSRCVLIIASDGWFAAYDKSGPADAGLGSAAEADLVRQYLYDHRGDNGRIRLGFLHTVDPEKVPPRLRAWQPFRPLDSDRELDALVRWAADCLGLDGIEPPTLRWPAPIAFEPDLADRKDEWPAIVDLLAGRSPERILLYEGASGLGKSVLMRHAAAYARRLGIPVGVVNFKGVLHDLQSVLGQIDLELGEHLPNFSREGARQTHLLRRDLRALRRPILLIVDGYDTDIAENKVIADWLSQQVLNEVETALGLAVIVAGQRTPEYLHAGWRGLARHLPLRPISELAYWEPWVAQRFPGFLEKGAHLPTVLMLTQGNPSLVSSYCEFIAKR